MDDSSVEKIIHDGFVRFGKMVTRASILVEGVIKSVDEINFTCIVTIESSQSNTDYNNVPLKVLTGSQASFIEIPSVGSNCTLCFRDNNIQRPQLVQVDQSDKILFKVGNSTLQIDNTGFVFNGGGSGGMVELNALFDNIQLRENRLNAIVTALTSLASACTSAGGAPLTGSVLGGLITTALTPIATAIPATIKADLASTTIKQG